MKVVSQCFKVMGQDVFVVGKENNLEKTVLSLLLNLVVVVS